MRLTSAYTRVARPHFEACPWCGVEIVDWFMEWYLPPEKGKVEDGELAMDCPDRACRRPVLYNPKDLKNKLIRALKGTVPVQRPIKGAMAWATDPSQGYSDLVSFLTNPGEQIRAKHFRSGYWKGVNV